MGLSICLSVCPLFHRYHGACIGVLGIQDICHFLPEIWDTCLFTSSDTVTPPPPSTQASAMHGYFVSATPLTVILFLLIHCLMFLPFVCLFSVFGSCFVVYYSLPSLVLQSSWPGRWSWLLYLVVLLMCKLCSVALTHVAVDWPALWECGISWSYCMHGSRKYHRWGGGSRSTATSFFSPQLNSQKTNGFFSKKTIIFQGSRVKPTFSNGGGGGGGGRCPIAYSR